MAFFPASMPDQVLCKKHQLKALRKQHSSWMKQREEALAQENQDQQGKPAQQKPKQQITTTTPKVKANFTVTIATPDDDKELAEMNDFLTAVGVQLEDEDA